MNSGKEKLEISKTKLNEKKTIKENKIKKGNLKQFLF